MQTKAKTPDTARIPPHDIQTEQEILGGALWNHLACVYAVTSLSDDDFYPEAHQRIFRAIKSEFDKEPEGVNTASVAFELKRRETLEECGGIEYLDRLCGEYVTDVSHRLACKRLRELAALREAQKLGHSIFAEAEALPDDPLTFISEKLAALQALHEKALAAGGPGYTTAEVAAAELGEISWAWEPWLPNGFLTLIGGETGIGKSKIALRLVESVVRPRPWPNGAPGPSESRPVLYVDTEGAQGMQYERMRAAGLPMDRIFVPGEDGNRHLQLDDPTTIPFVKQTCEREKIGLVVVDSLRSGMGGDENSSEFGEKLQPWGGLARDLGIPILIVHHANKALRDAEMDLHRIRGSSAITALPRSVIAIDRPDDSVDRLRVKQVKNNLAKMAEPFGVELTEYGCDPAPVPHSPRTDFRAAEAEDWLREELRHGPRQCGEIRDSAEDAGIAQRTLYRARDVIGVRELPDPENPRRRLWALAAKPEDEALQP